MLLNGVWLGGLHSCVDNTPSSFFHVVSLAASAIYSALSEHLDSKFRLVEFSPARTEGIYTQVLSLLNCSSSEQLNFLKERIRAHNDSLVNTYVV